jgi:dTDP-4-amino-4,6-dideoxygalactose transaminase
MAHVGIETRPFFKPLDQLPIWRGAVSAVAPYQRPCPVSNSLYERGLVLPCHAGLDANDVAYVCETLRRLLA